MQPSPAAALYSNTLPLRLDLGSLQHYRAELLLPGLQE